MDSTTLAASIPQGRDATIIRGGWTLPPGEDQIGVPGDAEAGLSPHLVWSVRESPPRI
jgi:hypothetical protein